MPAARRSNTTSGSLGDRGERLKQEFAKLAENDEEEEMSQYLSDIVTELFSKPHKIKPCRRAVLSNMFDEEPSDSNMNFKPSTLYLNKVPKDHIRGLLIKFTKMPDAFLKLLEKQRPGVLRRLFARTTMTELSDPNPWLDKAKFDLNMISRRRSVGDTTFHKTEAGDDIDWVRSGYYKLLPEFAGGGDVTKHKYTEVSFLQKVTAPHGTPRGAQAAGQQSTPRCF